MKEDWIEIALGEVCDYSKGKKPKLLNKEYSDIAPFPYINIKAFEKGIFDEYTDGVKCNLCEEGDLLMVWDGARAGFTGKAKKGAIGSTLMKIEPKVGVEKNYLFYFLLSLYKKLNTNPRGVGIPHVEPRLLWDSKLIFPSLPIQRAIVSKIETLFSDLDNGIADLKKVQEQLKIYRQAVLKKAFEGELTKEWREQRRKDAINRVSTGATPLPTAEELLEQIKQERQKHYEQQVEEWKQAVKSWEENGKEEKKPSKPKTTTELPPLSEEELNSLHKTSKSWTWCKVDKIAGHNANALKAGPFGSSLKKEFYTPQGYKIYGQEQVISGDSKFGDYYVNEAKYNDLINCAVFPLDILISLVGTVGKVLVLPEDAEMGIINPRLVKITLNSFYDSIFFKYYFESSFLKSLYKVKNHGTTMDVLNLTSIKELPFPLCSLEEQHQIVREIESRLSVCDKVEQNITEALHKSEALRQSILKKAFEGKLLSEAEIAQCKQEADYEPASKLLERIRKDAMHCVSIKK